MRTKLGSVGLVAGAMASALACYTVSLKVSAERADADRMRAQIASDLRDIRALEAELRTRSRLPQLENWNNDVLALSAPTPKQYAASHVVLASFAPKADAPAAVPSEPAVQYAIADAARTAQQPATIQTASYAADAPVVAPKPQQFGLQRASYRVEAPAPVQIAAVNVTVQPAKLDMRPARERTAAAVEAKASAKPKPAAPEVKKPATSGTKPLPAIQTAKAQTTQTPPAAAPVRVASLGLSDTLASEIESAAAVERAGLQRVSMR